MAFANAQPKSPKIALKEALVGFDMQSIVGNLTEMLRDTVAEVTDPRFQAILTTLAEDAIKVQVMKQSGASAEIIAEAEDAIRARTQSIAKVPGLIVAGRQQQVLGMVSRGIGLVSSIAFNFIRAYAGLPPVSAGSASSAAGQ